MYVQHASTQPVSLNPLMKWRNRPWIGLQWLVRRGPGASNQFEGGGFVRSNDDVALPQPDVPLPADRRALRRLGARRRARLPGARRADVLRRPRLGADHVARRAGQAGAAVQLPVDRPGSARVGRGDPRRPPHPRPAGVRPRSTAARSRPDPACRPTSEILDWVARDAETALHPSCTCRMGAGEMSVIDPRLDRRPRRGGRPGGRRLGRCRTSRTATSTPR